MYKNAPESGPNLISTANQNFALKSMANKIYFCAEFCAFLQINLLEIVCVRFSYFSSDGKIFHPHRTYSILSSNDYFEKLANFSVRKINKM
jgi:hypothetical protein